MRTEEEIRAALQREAARHPVNPVLPGPTLRKARASRALMLAGVGVVAASLAFGGAGIVRLAGGQGTPSRPASSPTSGSDASSAPIDAPFLLVTEEGWRVTYADEYGDEIGEMRFTDGTHELDLHWQPRKYHHDYLLDRRRGSEAEWPLEIAGKDAVLFKYQGRNDFTAMWLDGDSSFELRGFFDDVNAYRAVVGTIERVAQEEWLAALPDDIIDPSERPAVVDQMLADVPVHPAVDVNALKTSSTVSHRYQLGAHVTGVVACAWIEQWIDAQASEDSSSAREAEAAMASSRDWAIMIEMDRDGDWPEAVWQFADAIAGDGQVVMGRTMSVVESYEQSLDCVE
jgi:hypothetical protein